MPIATRPITREWTIPAAGRNTLWEIIDDATVIWMGYVSIRAGRDNSADIVWTDVGGQAGGYLGAGEAALVGDEYGSSQMKEFTFKGTEGDRLFLTIGVSLG